MHIFYVYVTAMQIPLLCLIVKKGAVTITLKITFKKCYKTVVVCWYEMQCMYNFKVILRHFWLASAIENQAKQTIFFFIFDER